MLRLSACVLCLAFLGGQSLADDGDFYLCTTLQFQDTSSKALPDPGFRDAALAKKFSIGEMKHKIVLYTQLADMSSETDFDRLPDTQLDIVGTHLWPDLQTLAITRNVGMPGYGSEFPATLINVTSFAVHTWFLSCKKL